MDFNALMEQAQKMSEQAQKNKEELEAKEYTAQAGGDGVTVVMNGKYEIKQLTIKPDLMNAEDREMVQDLVTVAVNEVTAAITKDQESAMMELAGNASIPGLM